MADRGNMWTWGAAAAIALVIFIANAIGGGDSEEPAASTVAQSSCVDEWDRLLGRWDGMSAQDRSLAGFSVEAEMFEVRRLAHFRLWAEDNGHPERCWSGDDVVGAYQRH